MTDPSRSSRGPGDSIETKPDWAARFVALPGFVQLALWLVPIFVLKSASLFEPPVWDSAMGVFPPATYLHQTHFDIRGLLAEPNWWLGGPNVHSLSLLTWFVALVMTATNSATATFAIVHVTTYVLVAWSLVLFTRVLLRDGFHRHTVLAAGVFVLVMPLVLVQVGALYTETWVMVLGVAAWARWREGKATMAIVLCVVALFVKLTAIAICVCVGLALLISRRPSGIRRLVLLLLLPLAFFVQRSLPGWLGARSFDQPGWGDARVLADALLDRLAAIPDVTVVILCALLGTLVQIVILRVRGARLRNLIGADRRTGAQLICLAMPFIFSMGIAASVFSETIFLPRYLVPIVPFCVASILFVARSWGRERIASGALVLGSLINLINFNGVLYPQERGSFSIVERSHAYRDFHRLQIDLIDALVEIPPDIPTFVSKELDYMVSDPMMGYVARKLPLVEPIYLPPYRDQSLAEFPAEFALVLSNEGHGGQEIRRLARAAANDPTIRMRHWTFERGSFTGAVFWIRRGGSATDEKPRVDAATHATGS